MEVVVTIENLQGGKKGAPSVKRFSATRVTIGRANSNDIVLVAAEVSGKHAELTVKDGKLVISDVGSSNGTYREEKRLQPKIETLVGGEQRVVIGHFLLNCKLEQADNKVAAEAKPAPVNVAPPVSSSASSSGSGRAESSTASRAKLLEAELKIKRQIHEQLIHRLDLRRKDILALSEGEMRKRAQVMIETVLVEMRWEMPVGLDREKLIKQILDEALALGPLEELLADETVTEVMVNSFDMIFAERQGKLALTDYRFSSEQAVLAAIERIIAPIGRRIDESSPIVDARLKDGSRVNAVIRPLALKGPCITIRKFSKSPLTIENLVGFGSMTKGMADFLKIAVENRLNLVISGGTGSGKTTLLNVVSSFIPHEQRIITVEDAAELRLSQDHVVAFETRPPNLEGKGSIAIRDLVRNSLRMRPDRIIVGECRGAEALDMLQAMNTGHDGSMTTGHANSPRDMIARLETMVLMAGMDLPVRAIREQITSAVQVVVQQTRFSCGTRRVTAISEVVGLDPDEGTVILQDVFVFRQEGYDSAGKTRGIHQATGYVPKFFRRLQQEGKSVNADVFSPG